MLCLSMGVMLAVTGCRNSTPTETATQSGSSQPTTTEAASTASGPADSMTDEMRNLAGATAINCGHVATAGNVQPASDCAVQANNAGKPFYVRYDLPMPDAQMAIGTVRTADGRLMTVQYDSKGLDKPQEGGRLSGDKKVSVVPCPTPENLRVANSGRVTCFPPSQMPAGMSPHAGGVTMPPAGASPHGGMMQVPKNLPSPHKTAEQPKK